MKKVKLEIVALSHSVSQSQSYAVVLGELTGRPRRRLPIVIGAFEAQAIAVAIEKITPTRPLTHDLIKNIFGMIDVELKEIIIDNLQEGIFYSKLICLSGGKEIEIDSRTSDALALAVRFNCPIYTYEFILESAGIILEEDESLSGNEIASTSAAPEEELEPAAVQSERTLDNFSLAELNDRLKEVLDQEDYEKAIRIRDEIERRKREST
ncbi:MAG: bifunctional DNase/RNase [Limisphaerales bacterium]|jgi:bifunctional DNase/RNase